MILPDKFRQALVIVAHPDDETLWMGGTILMQPDREWHISSLSRKDDPDRAPRFQHVLETFHATGGMGDLDDEPDQHPLESSDVQETIVSLLPPQSYDIIFTHSPLGEYTRHRRHEEVSRAVLILWKHGRIQTNEIWLFAYEDGGKPIFPDRFPRHTSVSHYRSISGSGIRTAAHHSLL